MGKPIFELTLELPKVQILKLEGKQKIIWYKMTGCFFRPTISSLRLILKKYFRKKSFIFSSKSLQHVCPSCQTMWTRAKEIFQFFKKIKTFKGTILGGGSPNY